MATAAGAPIGYRGTRGEILTALKMSQPLTAKELADKFGVTPNALRRHLKELENEGIVRYQREIRGVGGPVFAFSLTDAGEALFPRGYERALSEILDLVREQQGDEALVRLFQRRWEDIARVARPELERLPVEQRATRLAELLTSLGYMAEARPVAGEPVTRQAHFSKGANCCEYCISENQLKVGS
jgi:DeoR family suf operon transcriptional repressor